MTVADAKDLLQRLIGGSGGKKWCSEHGREALPGWLQEFVLAFDVVRLHARRADVWREGPRGGGRGAPCALEWLGLPPRPLGLCAWRGA